MLRLCIILSKGRQNIKWIETEKSISCDFKSTGKRTSSRYGPDPVWYLPAAHHVQLSSVTRPVQCRRHRVKLGWFLNAMDCSALKSKKTLRSQTKKSDRVRYKTHNHGSRRTWSSLVLSSNAPCAVDLSNQPHPRLILARTTPWAVALSYKTCPMHKRVGVGA